MRLVVSKIIHEVPFIHIATKSGYISNIKLDLKTVCNTVAFYQCTLLLLIRNILVLT